MHGLLQAKANRGILYVDEVNLLDDGLVDVVLDSAASGINTVEREGISIVHPAKFIMIGSGNPAVSAAATKHGTKQCISENPTASCMPVYKMLCLLERVQMVLLHVTLVACKEIQASQNRCTILAVLPSCLCAQEGELRPQLLDRFGMSVQVSTLQDVGQRTQMVLDRIAFEADAEAFVESCREEQEELTNKLIKARQQLKQ